MPRALLLLFCAAYVLPGQFGRDPWKSADLSAFGYMLNIAQGRTSWLAPTVGGLPADTALLPYWLGAAFIKLLGPWLGTALAARVPFALLLVSVLMLVWSATYHLARTKAAQPLPWAFGGGADPIDYARAVADGALLALIASLGLLQLGHETTPELAQLVSVTLFLYALAASPFRPWHARLAAMVALPTLSVSGAPSVALGLALVGTLLTWRSSYEAVRRFSLWIAGACVLAALLATLFNAWSWRVGMHGSMAQWIAMPRQLLWFTWPAWPLALWTLWRWRAQLQNRHISVPLGCLLVSLLAWSVLAGSDRALMLGLPPLAVLAAFALPTLQRSTAAAIDWFSVFFFSTCALVIWVIYVAMQTGVPSRPAANVARLAPGFEPAFSLWTLSVAAIATLAWLWLVKWRSGRNRHPLWKSLVLPASGVALCWLLLMTLWLPLLDYARGYRAMVARVADLVPLHSCLAAPGTSRALAAALEYHGGYLVDARLESSRRGACDYLLQVESRALPRQAEPGWRLLGRVGRPTDPKEIAAVYRRDVAKP